MKSIKKIVLDYIYNNCPDFLVYPLWRKGIDTYQRKTRAELMNDRLGKTYSRKYIGVGGTQEYKYAIHSYENPDGTFHTYNRIIRNRKIAVGKGL